MPPSMCPSRLQRLHRTQCRQPSLQLPKPRMSSHKDLSHMALNRKVKQFAGPSLQHLQPSSCKNPEPRRAGARARGNRQQRQTSCKPGGGADGVAADVAADTAGHASEEPRPMSALRKRELRKDASELRKRELRKHERGPTKKGRTSPESGVPRRDQQSPSIERPAPKRGLARQRFTEPEPKLIGRKWTPKRKQRSTGWSCTTRRRQRRALPRRITRRRRGSTKLSIS